jgi:asparagine synthase (glutamine-hydrolysing)
MMPGRPLPEGAAERMTDALIRRGPDARGVFLDEAAGVALGQRRLAIVDLTPTGAQPMTAVSGRYVMVLNGEIYNFRDLRAELEAAGIGPWRGTSDTEVLLNGIERWGLEDTLKRCDGMFAFALWDREARTLALARDRFGEKPLFIADIGEGIAFASQLGAIIGYPGFAGASDEAAIDQFLTLSYIPEPKTPFTNIQKLPPGSYAILRPGERSFTPIAYWSAAEAARSAHRNAARTPEAQAEVITAIEQRLHTAVSNQMLADVPLGAFLSGGVDSSLIVALMQAHSTRPVKTYTIGFEDEAYNEAPFAKAVAGHLGTDHTEVMVTWQDALDLVAGIADTYDEPFADSSQLPTCLVSKVARQHVTVALSGDAGDEVFGGYNRHKIALGFGRMFTALPAPVRQGVGGVIGGIARSSLMAGVEKALGAAGAQKRIKLLGEKASKFASALSCGTGLAFYLSLVRRDDGLSGVLPFSGDLDALDAALGVDGFNLAEKMMLLDTLTYLPGDILTKVDRAAMSVSLETRAPYLDHKLYELAWRLPADRRIKDGATKAVLRDLLYRHVPKDLIERPKAGFGVPIAAWLRGPLKGWMADLAADFIAETPRHAGLARTAQAALDAGSPTAHHLLWNIAMLQSWRRRWRA